MRFLTLSFIALLFAGCAGYHIGPVRPKFMTGVETIAVPNFKNETLIPRVEVLMAGAVEQQIQLDGTYKIANSDRADAVLEGKIVEIRRNSARSVHGDVLTAREYRLTVRIEYKVTKRSTGEQLAHRTVTGDTSFFVDPDLAGDVISDERQAIPLATKQAAINLVSQIAEGW